jgi:peroxiredoxin
MPSYEEDLSEFERRNAQVLGISTDQVFTNEAWAKSGVLRGESGVCERAIFVVDKQGKVAYIDIHDISEQPPTDKIMAALDKLK